MLICDASSAGLAIGRVHVSQLQVQKEGGEKGVGGLQLFAKQWGVLICDASSEGLAI
jgi:hypothetical protein